MGLGGVAIAVLPSMIHPKRPFSDGLGGQISVLEKISSTYDTIYCLVYNKLFSYR